MILFPFSSLFSLDNPPFISSSSQAFFFPRPHSSFPYSRMSPEPTTQYHHHERLRVSGGVIPDAITAYRPYGNPANPCIVFPTCYGGKLDSESNHAKRLSTVMSRGGGGY